MKLSICLIAKDEERNIGRCLKSVQNIADEIVVVDTGSTDNTIEIAKKYNAKVLHHKWDNDFSAARNKSIDNATGDWILFLDADEELPSPDDEMLRKALEDEKVFEAYYFRMVNFIKGQDIGSAIVLRAFRNRPEYRFTGKLHEQVIQRIQERSGIESILGTQYRIFHYGYDPDIVEPDKKSKRNLDILLAYKESEKDGYYYYALGNEYARMDDYKSALVEYKNGIKKTDYVRNKYIYTPYLVLNMIKSYSVLKQYNEVLKLINLFKNFLPDFKDMYFLGALACIEIGKYSKAKEYLNKYSTSKNSSYEYPDNNYHTLYNIPEILSQIEVGIIDSKNNLMDTCIIVDSDSHDLINNIKSSNEISSKIIVVDLQSNHSQLPLVEGYGATLINGKLNTSLKSLSKHFTSKWTLILNHMEILPFGQQSYLLTEISALKGDGIEVEVLNTNDNEVTRELRIFKKLPDYKIEDIKDLSQIFRDNSKIVDELDVTIYKF